MSENIIERAAIAITPGWATASKNTRRNAMLTVAGVLEAIKEPTKAMSKAGFHANTFKNYHDGEPGCPGVKCPVEPPEDWLDPANAEAVKAYLAAPKCLVARATIPAEPAWQAMIDAALADKPV